MTTTDTKISELIINKLSKEQYASITPNENEIYLVEDDFNPDALSNIAYSGSFSDLLNKPTTISGYGITNAYTKTEVDNLITSTYKAAGSASSVSNLGTLDASHEGFVYNMTADFTTTSDFVEGAGKQHYAGANVAIVNTGTTASPVYKYDILGDFIDLSGYQLSNTAVTHTASTSVGDSTTPVYINSNGVATALSYTIAKSVPADALFTDTVYTHPTDAGNKHIPSGGSAGQVLAYGGSSGTASWTTLTIPDAQIQSDWNQTNTSAKDYIKNKPTIPEGAVVDQTYDSTSTNAQSGVAIQGELSTNYQPKLVSGTNIKTLNSTSLLGNGNINVLQNTATGINSLTILGTPTDSNNCFNIGYGSSITVGNSSNDDNNAESCILIGKDSSIIAGVTTRATTPEQSVNSVLNSIAIGHNATLSATNNNEIRYATAIGCGAGISNAVDAIQLGYGINSTNSTFNVGFYNNSGTHYNWQLLDGTTGLIPDARLSSNIARTVDIPSAVTETTVSGWGFTKNTGTVTSVNNVSPVNGNVTLSIPTITDTYDGTSSNGMSGKAVKSAIDTAISSVYKASGSIAFANRPTPGSSYVGNVYNITDSFTTTSDFVEGAGKTYPAGTNIVCINTTGSTYKYDVLAGFVDLSGYQPSNTAVTHTASTKVGDTNQPVYIAADGTATAISYTIATSVPSGALFTDTKYTAGSSNTVNKLFLVGALYQGTGATNEQAKETYSNNAVYTQGGFLYATTPVKSTNDTTVATTKFVKDQGYTSNTGTITGITMNGASKGTSGVVDLGTVLTSHQDISGKQDTLVSGTNIKTINNESILGSGNISTSDVYIAEYGTTTYQEVLDAYNAGKTVVCHYTTGTGANTAHSYLTLSVFMNTIKYFIFFGAATLNYIPYYCLLDYSTGWSYERFQYQAPISGGATSITVSDLTVNRALTSNSSGKVAVSTTTSTELGYVHGVTSAIQAQLDSKISNALQIIDYSS